MSTLTQQINSAAKYSAASHALMLGAALSGVIYHPEVSGNQVKMDVMRASGMEWEPLRESAATLRQRVPHFTEVRHRSGIVHDIFTAVGEGLISVGAEKLGEWLGSLVDGHSKTAESSEACADALQKVMELTDSAMEDVVDVFTTLVTTSMPLIIPLPGPAKKIAMQTLITVANATGMLLLQQLKDRDRALGDVFSTLSGHCHSHVDACREYVVQPPSRCGDTLPSQQGTVPPRQEPLVTPCTPPEPPATCESPAPSTPPAACSPVVPTAPAAPPTTCSPATSAPMTCTTTTEAIPPRCRDTRGNIPRCTVIRRDMYSDGEWPHRGKHARSTRMEWRITT